MSFLTNLLSPFSGNRKQLSELSESSATSSSTYGNGLSNAEDTAIHDSSEGQTEAFHDISTIQPIKHERVFMTTATETYAKLTDAEKVIELEKAVEAQGNYLKAYRDSIKLLNRRNTLAVIELQKLVHASEKIHPDLIPMINPVMLKVSEILDFSNPYEVT